MLSSLLNTGNITGNPVPNLHFEVGLPNGTVVLCDPAGYASFSVALAPDHVQVDGLGSLLSAKATGDETILSDIRLRVTSVNAGEVTCHVVAMVDTGHARVSCPD